MFVMHLGASRKLIQCHVLPVVTVSPLPVFLLADVCSIFAFCFDYFFPIIP